MSVLPCPRRPRGDGARPGVTLSIAGMVTDVWVTVLGIGVALVAALGWFQQVLPVERHELLPLANTRVEITRSANGVARLGASSH